MSDLEVGQGGSGLPAGQIPAFSLPVLNLRPERERLGGVEREGGLKEDGAKWGVQRAHHD